MENQNPGYNQNQPPQNQGSGYVHPTQNFAQPATGKQIMLPKSIGSMVAGILAVNLCFVYGIGGIIAGIIALVMAGKSKAIYDQNPALYKPFCLTFVKVGKICGLIGLILGVLILIGVIFLIIYAVNNQPSYPRYYY